MAEASGRPPLVGRREACAIAIGMALGVIGLSGCASESAFVPGGPVAEEIRIGLTEWAVSVPAVVANAGAVRLLVTNAGASRHRLVVVGEQGRWETAELDPGERAELSIRTVAGETLRMGCDVRGHDAHGLHEALRVAG